MVRGFLGLQWFLWAGVALLIAIIYSFVWPKKVTVESTGFRWFVIRWGHAVTWILLAINFVMRGIGPDLNGGASFFALAGAVMYVLFIAMSFVIKK